MKQNQTDTGKHLDFLLLDIVALLLSFTVSYVLKFGNFGFLQNESWMALLFLVSLLNVVICLLADPYSKIFRRPYYEEIVQALLLTCYNLLAAGVIFYVFKVGTLFSRQMILTMYGFFLILSVIFNCTWKKLILSQKISLYNPKPIALFLIGNASSIGDAMKNAMAGDFNAYAVKGVHLTDTTEMEEVSGVPVFNNREKLLENLCFEGIEEVLIVTEEFATDAAFCRGLIANGIGVHFDLQSMLGFQAEDYDVDSVGVYRTLSVGLHSFTSAQKVYLIVKRLLDVLLGIIGCILLLPVLLFVKIAYICAGDREKIVYSQMRVGKNGKPIRIYKLRTMVPHAEKVLEELLKEEKYHAEWEANQKLEKDPRITKCGRFLRKTSIDELPQMWNVLKGEMSLVGPRPLVQGELEAHDGLKLYQQVKPGITGWWGCNGRSNIHYRERLELEYYYIKNLSAYLDFLCVLRTILAITKRDGAE